MNLRVLFALFFPWKRDRVIRARFFRSSGLGSKLLSLMTSENRKLVCIASNIHFANFIIIIMTLLPTRFMFET